MYTSLYCHQSQKYYELTICILLMISHTKKRSYKVTIHDTAAAGEETASLFLQVAAVATPGIVSDDQEAGGSTSHSGFQFS